jgi:hypothetical protein
MTTAAARDEWERVQDRANGQNNPLTGKPNLTVANDGDKDGVPKAKDPANIKSGEDLDDTKPEIGAKP